jgi:hypothetical protein
MSDPWNTMTNEDDTCAWTDERWVFELLCGMDGRPDPARFFGKRFRRMYPTGDGEVRARAALARLIRKGDPFPLRVREALAGLFDPANTNGRRVEFKPGRQTSSQEITLIIAAYVWARMKMGEKKEAAVASAMAEFNVKRRQIFKICRDHDVELPGLASALK